MLFLFIYTKFNDSTPRRAGAFVRRAVSFIAGWSLLDVDIPVLAFENTPTSTAKSFAEDDFYDRYGTAGKIASAGISADNLRLSGDAAELGGLLSANLTLARRGIV